MIRPTKNPESRPGEPGFQKHNTDQKHNPPLRRLQVGGDVAARHAGDALRAARATVEALYHRRSTAKALRSVSRQRAALYALEVALTVAADAEPVRSAENWIGDAGAYRRDGDSKSAREALLRAAMAIDREAA